MAVSTRNPHWPVAAQLSGCFLLYLGSKLLDGSPLGVGCKGLGAALLGLGWVGLGLVRTSEGRAWRNRQLLDGSMVAAGVLAIFGSSWVNGASRWNGVLLAAGASLLLVGALGLIGGLVASSTSARMPWREPGRAARLRSRGHGAAWLMVAVFFANFIGARHELRLDGDSAVATPSDATLDATRALTVPTEVILFYPAANEVGDTVQRYFEALAATNPLLSVTREDHALAFDRAEKAEVSENGYVALLRGEAAKKIRIGEDPRGARGALRRLDGDVLRRLMELSVVGSVAYFTSGHGERSFDRAVRGDGRTAAKTMKRQLEAWQFSVKPLGLAHGSADQVPEDAGLVIVLDPSTPFLPGEVEALRAALDRGVRILLALDHGPMGLEPLLDDLGVEMGPGPLAHPSAFAPLTRTAADRHAIWANRYSSHPSVSTMTRDDRMVTVFQGTRGVQLRAAKTERTQPTLVLSAAEGTFADLDGDYRRSEDEPSERYGLAAAVARTASVSETRVFVLGDADVFGDTLLEVSRPNLYLLRDVVQWLQIDTPTVVPTVQDRDVKIVHRAEEDAALFYGSTFGVPLLLLGIGALATRRRRAS